tara:strand:- start:1709 stop:2974 length:1266 start_codon:yes stop_codon:yes gene_type:complete
MSFAGRLKQALSGDAVGRFREGFGRDFSVGREQTQAIANEARKRAGLPKEMPQIDSYFANHPTAYRTRELLGKADPHYLDVRAERGMGLSDDLATRAGQLAGTVGRDIVEDGSRSLWWLLNAAQAAGNVAAEKTLHRANMGKFYDPAAPLNPNLIQGKDYYRDADGNMLDSGSVDKALKEGLVNLVPDTDGARGAMKFEPAAGVTYVQDPNNPDKKVFAKSNYSAVQQKLPLIATGLGVNTAIGLMNPFGGAEGYKAVIPSDEDPSVSENVPLEVGMKYLLGRTGGILPYSEFVKVRPDVSPEEYKAYKAYKGSRAADLNLMDGDFALPYVLKGTTDGIHGAEIDFLGRSIPVNTGVIPIASSIAGAALGSRIPKGKNIGPLMGATAGSFAGLGAGNIVGGLLEAERRRRNEIENEDIIMG